MSRKAVDFDPAVLAALSDADQRVKRRGMSAGQRKRADRDEARSKATYDLPAWLIQAVTDLAERQQVSKSSLVAFLLARALEAYRRGDWNFDGYHEPSRSPRYRFVLRMPDVDLE